MEINNIKDAYDCRYFFKIIEKKWHNNIVKNGQIYFGILSLYRQMSRISKLKSVGDNQEACLTKNTAMYMDIYSDYFQIHGKEAGYNCRIEANQCVFCTYVVGLKNCTNLNDKKYIYKIPSKDIQSICKDKGGENNCEILIFDDTIINKILTKVKTQFHNFSSGDIFYDDFNYIPKNKICTPEYALECCFHKPSNYRYQNEFRIAVLNNEKRSIDNLFINVSQDDFSVVPIQTGKDFIIETTISQNNHITDKMYSLKFESTFYFSDKSEI